MKPATIALAVALVFVITGGASAQTCPPGERAFGIARLKYGGGGDWYEDRTSLVNLLRGLRERTTIPVSGRAKITAHGKKKAVSMSKMTKRSAKT